MPMAMYSIITLCIIIPGYKHVFNVHLKYSFAVI